MLDTIAPYSPYLDGGVGTDCQGTVTLCAVLPNAAPKILCHARYTPHTSGASGSALLRVGSGVWDSCPERSPAHNPRQCTFDRLMRTSGRSEAIRDARLFGMLAGFAIGTIILIGSLTSHTTGEIPDEHFLARYEREALAAQQIVSDMPTSITRGLESTITMRNVSAVHESFFFIWTTGPETFDEPNMLVLESVFAVYPAATVDVYTNTLPYNYFDQFLRLGYSISVQRFVPESMVRPGDAGYKWISNRDRWSDGKHFKIHLSDWLRLVLISKLGGSYFDFDVIITQPMPESIVNAAGVEPCTPVNQDCFRVLDTPKIARYGSTSAWDVHQRISPANGILIRWEPLNPIATAGLRWFDDHYNPSCWGCGGPSLLAREAPRFPLSIQLLPTNAYYRVGYDVIRAYLSRPQPELAAALLTESFGFHLSGSQTARKSFEAHSLVASVLSERRIFRHWQLRDPIARPTPADPDSTDRKRFSSRFEKGHAAAAAVGSNQGKGPSSASSLRMQYPVALWSVVEPRYDIRQWGVVLGGRLTHAGDAGVVLGGPEQLKVGKTAQFTRQAGDAAAAPGHLTVRTGTSPADGRTAVAKRAVHTTVAVSLIVPSSLSDAELLGCLVEMARRSFVVEVSLVFTATRAPYEGLNTDDIALLLFADVMKMLQGQQQGKTTVKMPRLQVYYALPSTVAPIIGCAASGSAASHCIALLVADVASMQHVLPDLRNAAMTHPGRVTAARPATPGDSTVPTEPLWLGVVASTQSYDRFAKQLLLALSGRQHTADSGADAVGGLFELPSYASAPAEALGRCQRTDDVDQLVQLFLELQPAAPLVSAVLSVSSTDTNASVASTGSTTGRSSRCSSFKSTGAWLAVGVHLALQGARSVTPGQHWLNHIHSFRTAVSSSDNSSVFAHTLRTSAQPHLLAHIPVGLGAGAVDSEWDEWPHGPLDAVMGAATQRRRVRPRVAVVVLAHEDAVPPSAVKPSTGTWTTLQSLLTMPTAPAWGRQSLGAWHSDCLSDGDIQQLCLPAADEGRTTDVRLAWTISAPASQFIRLCVVHTPRIRVSAVGTLRGGIQRLPTWVEAETATASTTCAKYNAASDHATRSQSTHQVEMVIRIPAYPPRHVEQHDKQYVGQDGVMEVLAIEESPVGRQEEAARPANSVDGVEGDARAHATHPWDQPSPVVEWVDSLLIGLACMVAVIIAALAGISLWVFVTGRHPRLPWQTARVKHV